ncbi:MAG TPA: hypothetical protein VGD65_07105, partial [Chryseosolibacter sp.]
LVDSCDNLVDFLNLFWIELCHAMCGFRTSYVASASDVFLMILFHRKLELERPITKPDGRYILKKRYGRVL